MLFSLLCANVPRQANWIPNPIGRVRFFPHMFKIFILVGEIRQSNFFLELRIKKGKKMKKLYKLAMSPYMPMIGIVLALILGTFFFEWGMTIGIVLYLLTAGVLIPYGDKKKW